jgi:hypothetical protein
MTRYVIAPDVAIRLDCDETVNIRSWPRAPPLAGAAAPLSGSTLRIALVEASRISGRRLITTYVRSWLIEPG